MLAIVRPLKLKYSSLARGVVKAAGGLTGSSFRGTQPASALSTGGAPTDLMGGTLGCLHGTGSFCGVQKLPAADDDDALTDANGTEGRLEAGGLHAR